MITMTKQQKLDTLEAVEARAFAQLENADPAAVEFNNILNNVGLLRQITEMVRFGDINLFQAPDGEPPVHICQCAPENPEPVPPVKEEEPLVLGVTEPEDTAPWETEVSASPYEELKLEDVRAKLVALARSGVDLSNLFQGFGATKLSEVPKEKYGELLKLANAAAEESA